MPDAQPSAVAGAFRRPFAEQVAFFRQKMGNLVPTERWDDLTAAAHDTAFMVAGAQKASLLSDLAAAVDRAIVEGKSLEAFRREFEAAVKTNGWHGWTGEDTKGGRAWRTRTIYRTNATVSYAAGRYAQLEAAKWPFWVYRHGGSKDPRPEHLHVFDGLILPPGHPFWAKFYPPSDWGCSCYVVGARSMRAARRLGGDPDKRLPDDWDNIDPSTGEPAGIGRGWGYAPGASVSTAVAAQAATWKAQVRADFVASLPKRVADTIAEAISSAIESIDDLSAVERRAVYDYTNSAYLDINLPLREGRDLPPMGVALDAIMQRASLPQEQRVYRGVARAAAKLLRESDLEPGDVIRDLGFVSTSRNQKMAAGFRGDNGIMLIITVPKGSRALNVSQIAALPEEEELLLYRNLPLRVVRWRPDENILEVTVDG